MTSTTRLLMNIVEYFLEFMLAYCLPMVCVANSKANPTDTILVLLIIVVIDSALVYCLWSCSNEISQVYDSSKKKSLHRFV